MLEIKQNAREVAELIASKLKTLIQRQAENERAHLMDFAVDIPEDITDEDEAWRSSTGVYGVFTIQTPLDNESLLLAIGYYGGMDNISTVTVKTHYDIDLEELTGTIAQEIAYQVSLEIPGVTKFLVRHDEMFA